jgi:hypothetical protein
MAFWEVIVLIIAGAFLILPLAVVDYLAIGATLVTAEEDRQDEDGNLQQQPW